MKIKQLIFSVLASTLLFSLLSQGVSAQYGYGQYGQPAPQLAVSIEKLVGKPTVMTKGGQSDLQFVNNLSSTDPRFTPGQDVMFKLVVKNVSTTTLSSVEVKDFVPSFLDVIETPGSFDAGSRIITFNAGDFAIDEKKEFFVKMRVLAQEQLPSDRGLMCLVNRAQAQVSGVSDESTSQFCIEKQVTNIKQVPQAGPEAGILLMGFNFLSLGTGLALSKYRKKS